MFHEYWGLKEPPFENVADPRFFYKSAPHEEALSRLVYAVKGRKPGAMLIGEIGGGKTLISRALVIELMPEGKWEMGVITQPMLDPLELLREILYQLGIGAALGGKTDLFHALHDQMIKTHKEGKHTVLIVDDAQSISNMDTFDQLRLLLNFQLGDRFLLTLILVGQPEFKRKLSEMPALADRMSIIYNLSGLDLLQTKEYVTHRLQIAGSGNNIFTNDAIESIYGYTQGIPRKINNLCDLGLLVEFNQKLKSIDRKVISAVAGEVG